VSKNENSSNIYTHNMYLGSTSGTEYNTSFSVSQEQEKSIAIKYIDTNSKKLYSVPTGIAKRIRTNITAVSGIQKYLYGSLPKKDAKQHIFEFKGETWQVIRDSEAVKLIKQGIPRVRNLNK
jgi:hypothetical protein